MEESCRPMGSLPGKLWRSCRPIWSRCRRAPKFLRATPTFRLETHRQVLGSAHLAGTSGKNEGGEVPHDHRAHAEYSQAGRRVCHFPGLNVAVMYSQAGKFRCSAYQARSYRKVETRFLRQTRYIAGEYVMELVMKLYAMPRP